MSGLEQTITSANQAVYPRLAMQELISALHPWEFANLDKLGKMLLPATGALLAVDARRAMLTAARNSGLERLLGGLFTMVLLSLSL
ncbi:hypothetical protein ACJZ2D_011078 [Fusarium nematophilum]